MSSSPVAALLGMRPHQVDGGALRQLLGGRPVVVTGASRGVGRQVALRCGAAGAHVVLLARGADALEDLVAEVASTGGSATAIPVDLRDLGAATAAAERIVSAHGAPALLVSNAGHSIRRDLADYTDRLHDVTRLAGVNMLGPIALALPLLAAMRQARSGQLISVGTVGMALPGPGWSVYAATKAGFDAWLRAISPELRRDRVAVTSIHLPLTRTAMSAPTYRHSRLPSLSADDAATWVCRAALTRSRVVSPWWGRLGGVATSALPSLVDRISTAAWRRAS
ncbi:SDR family NAD(P)-dependent oxidoreductase [Pseudactinotalea suaedae]|uniref:SDR family NAD(P)-dependent oxidoreductase n=1 Tax=Pseudactinotalea suaedae TaxID=1524924 RepID=UPI0013911C9D|nr:SDR family NAD(P)-dependent oxidoreductase [Pseudactinotalea suaedae]